MGGRLYGRRGGGAACRTEHAARSTRRRSSSLATRYDYPGRLPVEIFPRPDICSMSHHHLSFVAPPGRAKCSCGLGAHYGCASCQVLCARAAFLDGFFSNSVFARPLLSTVLHAHTGILCGALVLGDTLPPARGRSVPGIYSPRSSALGTKGALSSLRGERGLSFVGDVVATALRAPLRPRLSPLDLPYPRPALIIAARLDLPIRALLFRVVALPVGSAQRIGAVR
ncbi:hypothetical protein C8R45DRAFT_527144 [Mycena sanguinolenta]|nr:hypothetical protein C8R45DRAFT_527144 [Mycena sanguinolenta]